MSFLTIRSAAVLAAVGDFNLVTMFRDATWTVRGVLLLLFAASIISIAIVVKKWLLISRVRRHGESLVDELGRADLKTFYQFALKSPISPYRDLFMAAHEEVQLIKESGRSMPEPQLDQALLRVMRKSQLSNISELEDRLVFLATTGSTAPFIGLFGTVWGIMNSFYKIGETGASSLAVVAPGISEALIATAVGLFAAIPAVIFYNFFTRRVREINSKLGEFRDDVMARLKHEYPSIIQERR